MITPSREEFQTAAEKDRFVPLRSRIPADLETPVSAFLKLRANLPEDKRARFLLESVERGIQVGRYSFIGVSASTTMELRDDVVTIRRDGTIETMDVGDRDPLSIIREEIGRMPSLTEFDLPGPFAGAVGYISYDVARYFERIPQPEDPGLDLPDYSFIMPTTIVVFDHVRSEIEIVVLPPAGDPGTAYDTAREEIELFFKALTGPLDVARANSGSTSGGAPKSNIEQKKFEKMVAEAKESILAGDAFQIVLSQRLTGTTRTNPFQIYRALRILNPSPYMFFLDFDGFELIGSSPEVLVKLEKRTATLSPIAGTRPRGESPARDLALEEELLADEKERAEHVMLVDLGRNDIGRVCETGSVATSSFMHIERYSHVMHIVSTVKGKLREGLDGFDLLRACFPAGTVSGAPKIRAMQIVTELEKDARGPYAGAVGYFSHDGDMDMCITIRTIVMVGDQYHIQAGAGIVADSDPTREYEETLSKAGALVKAVSIAEEGL